MRLRSDSLQDGQPIPPKYAFCIPDEESHAGLGTNVNPHLAWDDAPEGTRSFALICYDPDVPSKPDDVNQEGRIVPHDLERMDFFHWVLVDIPASVTEIPEGAESDGIVRGGKPRGRHSFGVRGRNTYTEWFEGDEKMGGTYGGYDGPCPPWNDERLHHYHFTLYALDTESLGLEGDFSGQDARDAMEGHVLAEARITGTYTLNPNVRG